MSVVSNDIDYFIEYFKYKSKLSNKTFLITGATGFIGSSLIKYLVSLDNSIRIIAHIRDINKAHAVLEHYENNNVEYIVSDLLDYDFSKLKGRCDFIIHCAAPTASEFFIEHPIDTFLSIVQGTQQILKGFINDKRVKSIVYLSSLEVYGDVVSDEVGILTESYQGYVNLQSIRSSYPIAKRSAESLCYLYVHEYGLPIKIARLTQVCGAGIDKLDNRIFTQFCRLKSNNEAIVLNTEGKSSRQYCYITDAIDAILTIALNGEIGDVYNVANDLTYISARHLAELICSLTPSVPLCVVMGNANCYASETYHKLSTEKLKSLGWMANVGLDEMVDRTIKYFKE